jgi:hypothetical protein
MWLTLSALAAGLLAFYWLCCLSSASLRQREEAFMNAILEKEWYWIWCHTTNPVGNVSYSTHERIDAVYATAPQAALWLAYNRHGIKPNMRLEAVKCVDDHDRNEARKAHQFVSEVNERFEQFMTLQGNTAHKDRSQ